MKPDVLFAAMKEYLEAQGWRVLVAGPTVVEQDVEQRSNNYRFVVNFLGSPPPGSEPYDHEFTPRR